MTDKVYDANSNITALIDDKGNRTAWRYDGINRVITETMPDGTVYKQYEYVENSVQKESTKREKSCILREFGVVYYKRSGKDAENGRTRLLR